MRSLCRGFPLSCTEAQASTLVSAWAVSSAQSHISPSLTPGLEVLAWLWTSFTTMGSFSDLGSFSDRGSSYLNLETIPRPALLAAVEYHGTDPKRFRNYGLRSDFMIRNEPQPSTCALWRWLLQEWASSPSGDPNSAKSMEIFVEWWTWWGMLCSHLDLVILNVFSNLINSVILWFQDLAAL